MINRKTRRFFGINNQLIIIAVLSCLFVLSIPKIFAWIFPARVGLKPISRIELWHRLEKISGEQVLSDMVNEKLIDKGLADSNVKVDESKIQDGVEKLHSQLKGRISKEEIYQKVRRQLQIEEVLDDKILVSNEEIRRYFLDKSNTTYKGKGLDEVSDEIEETIKNEKLQVAFEIWFAKLKDQTVVINKGL